MQSEVEDPKESAIIVVELSVEELEEAVAPKIVLNHNETLVSDEVELCPEDLEETIAPTPSIPIPPPLRVYWPA